MIKETASEAAGASGYSRAGWVSPSAVSPPPAAAADLFREIWAEVADWQCHQAFLERERRMQAAQPAPPPPEPPAELAKPVRALSTKAIMALEGEAFITTAYYSLLGRLPEPTGLAAMHAELVRGCSKGDMLRGIHDSLEAQQRRAQARKDLLTRPFAMVRQIRRGGLLDPSAGPLAPDEWRAQVERRLSEQQAALELVTTRLNALQTAQDELAQTTQAALLEQDRLLGSHAQRGASLAQQITTREDELVAATASLSNEVGALSHRLASMAQDGVAPRGLSRERGRAARRS